jgi:Flp pilus assembly pilin Flp
MENAMLWNEIKRLVREDAGMEMVEWSIVGVVFALAGAILWSSLRTQINSGLNSIGNCVGNSANCPGSN